MTPSINDGAMQVRLYNPNRYRACMVKYIQALYVTAIFDLVYK